MVEDWFPCFSRNSFTLRSKQDKKQLNQTVLRKGLPLPLALPKALTAFVSFVQPYYTDKSPLCKYALLRSQLRQSKP